MGKGIATLVAAILACSSLVAAADTTLRRKRQFLQVDAIDEGRNARAHSTESTSWGRHLGASPNSSSDSKKKGMGMMAGGDSSKKTMGGDGKKKSMGMMKGSDKNDMSNKGDGAKGMKKGMMRKPKKTKGDDMFADLLGDFSMSMSLPPTPAPIPVTTPAPAPGTPAPVAMQTPAPVAPDTPAPVAIDTPAPTDAPVAATPAPDTLTPTTSPFTTCNGLSRQDAFLSILTPITSQDLLLDPATPQYAAFAFLVSGDPAAVDPCTYPTVEERYASVVLYEATIGADWTDSTGWLSAASECEWQGLRCNDEGMVVSVFLPSNNLGGTLPEEISAFSELVAFDIFKNAVGGTIPESLPMLTKLALFDVEQNQMVGPAFVNVTGMDSLNVYRVSLNQFTGSLPLTALAEVTNLKQLWVAANNLAGTIPPTIALLTNLEMFYIYDNNFSGTLPNELQTLKLFALQAQGNMFTGAIPEGLYFNNALKQLRLDDNVFTGTISGRAGDLVDLEDLRLNGNELTGTIPATLSRLSQLRFLLVHDNMLEGTIRDAFDAFELLQFADYSNNVLTGMVPASIFDLPTIKTLYFSNNDLTGFIPSNYGNAALLEDLFLDGNQISGLVPRIDPGQLPDLTRFKIEDNNLTGSVPASVCALRLSDIGSLEMFYADCGGIPPEIECDADCCTSCFADAEV